MSTLMTYATYLIITIIIVIIALTGTGIVIGMIRGIKDVTADELAIKLENMGDVELKELDLYLTREMNRRKIKPL